MGRETTTAKERTTTPRETTTTKQQTTTQKHAQCPGDKKKDRNGCCPRLINGKWYYRDGRGCYPTETPKVDAKKGSIEVGKDADFVVWCPEEEFVVEEDAL